MSDTHEPARQDRHAVVERLVEQLPDRVDAILRGDREALINLLLIAADVAWQSRADALGTVDSVASGVHSFADAVADCYSAGEVPSDRLCDEGFALANRVDALAIEVLLRRRQSDNEHYEELDIVGAELNSAARHEARAHVAALRLAAAHHRAVQPLDVEAAEHLYGTIVDLARQHTRELATDAVESTHHAHITPIRRGGSPSSP